MQNGENFLGVKNFNKKWEKKGLTSKKKSSKNTEGNE